MATYRISGVWKDATKVITHYSVHAIDIGDNHRGKKMTKAETITLLETHGNTVATWVWNYSTAKWKVGEKVEVIDDDRSGKYLRTDQTTV